MNIIDKILSPLGRRLDESSPMVDARLPDGSRVNAIISPLSLIGPVVTVRKFSSTPLTIENVIAYKTLDENMAKFIEMAVKARLNIIVAGGTGSGKTTLLNVLSSFIFDDERIITIEDAAELKLMQPHVVSLESRPPNIEGKGQITIRDLVRNSLRMRPNRIIVGEVRGSEALDMIQAMNTGHEGSMSTVHSNSPRDTLSRISTMILYSGIDFPLKAIREQISSAIDLIIYLERLPDGSRRVTHITEVVGMENETITLQDVFYFQRTGIQDGKIQGEFKCSVVRPRILDKFKEQGMDIERW
jgi:pilus assembly protein CpaF